MSVIAVLRSPLLACMLLPLLIVARVRGTMPVGCTLLRGRHSPGLGMASGQSSLSTLCWTLIPALRQVPLVGLTWVCPPGCVGLLSCADTCCEREACEVLAGHAHGTAPAAAQCMCRAHQNPNTSPASPVAAFISTATYLGRRPGTRQRSLLRAGWPAVASELLCLCCSTFA